MTMRKYLALPAFLLLAACAVGPDYQKPDNAGLLPDGWFSPGAKKVTAADTQKAATDEAWWKNFHDPALDALIQKAAEGNLDLKIAAFRINQARATRASATSDLFPKVNATGSAVRQANTFAVPGGGFPGLTAPFNTFQAGFDASWELDLFGGHRRAVEEAEANVEAAEAQGQDTLVSLLAEVARTYVDIRQYQSQLSIASDMVKAERSTADITEERFKAGTAPHVDVTRATAELADAQAQIPYYQNLLAQAEYSCDVLLGAQPGATHSIIAGSGDIPVVNKQLVLDAPSKVIADRPDIRVAERKLAAATAQQGVATAQFFPDISLSGFLGIMTTDSGKIFDIHSKSWKMGGSILLPILNWGQLQANLDQANAEQQEALATYQKTILSALSDVEKSYTAYTKQEDYRATLQKAVKDNESATGVARQRYKDGLVPFLEVLDAQRSLYTSQSKVAEAKGKAAQNLIALYKSLGGGWNAGTNITTTSAAPVVSEPMQLAPNTRAQPVLETAKKPVK